jgi:LIVCS family branched-chain amino acid:cation transporter
MKRLLQSETVALGLAIFSMLFGAGNLIYPLAVGMFSGNLNSIGMVGFLITAICLPLIGILAMILFNGDYTAFFNRLGNTVGTWCIFLCMLILGPMIAMPRIVTLSYTMMLPFLPDMSILHEAPYAVSGIFSIIFLAITFLLTYRESKVVDILGRIVSPLLLSSLMIIIAKGLLSGQECTVAATSALSIFASSLLRGYETLDLLGAIFFSAIILSILRMNPANKNLNERQLMLIGLRGGFIGIGLLAIIYIGMSYLGVYHGCGLENVNPGELFREISIRVLGTHASLIIVTAVIMACLSTAIALTVVIAEYIQHTLYRGRISYIGALLLTIAACIPLSTAGLDHVLKLTGGAITFVGYPTLITLTLCNIAYKIWGFTPVKLPVAITFIASLIWYYVS